MSEIACVQGSPEWLAQRRGLCTASRFSDVLAGGKGITRNKYKLELVLHRVTGRTPEGFTTKAMAQGTEREPLAVAAYEARERAWTTECGFFKHATLMAGATPDRLIGDDGLLEVKAPETLAHAAVVESEAVPSEYWAQVQGELWICGRKWLDFVSWNPDFPEELQLQIVRVERDEKYIDRLRTEVSIFLDEVKAGEDHYRDLCQRRRA